MLWILFPFETGIYFPALQTWILKKHILEKLQMEIFLQKSILSLVSTVVMCFYREKIAGTAINLIARNKRCIFHQPHCRPSSYMSTTWYNENNSLTKRTFFHLHICVPSSMDREDGTMRKIVDFPTSCKENTFTPKIKTLETGHFKKCINQVSY